MATSAISNLAFQTFSQCLKGTRRSAQTLQRWSVLLHEGLRRNVALTVWGRCVCVGVSVYRCSCWSALCKLWISYITASSLAVQELFPRDYITESNPLTDYLRSNSLFFLLPIRRCLLQARDALSRPSTLTCRSWRSPRPPSPLSPPAPPSTSWATGRPTRTRTAGTSTTTAPPRRGPGNRREQRTAARGAPEETGTAQERAPRYGSRTSLWRTSNDSSEVLISKWEGKWLLYFIPFNLKVGSSKWGWDYKAMGRQVAIFLHADLSLRVHTQCRM